MESASHKILESVTQRTLHAHNFARSSTQASLLLTDLLSRYLTLLSSTCAKYAQHSGHGASISAYDAIAALDELGVSAEELGEYGRTEGVEYRRYTPHSARRREDIAEFRAHLMEGLTLERDAIRLTYAPYDESEQLEYDFEEDEDTPYMLVDEPEQPHASSSNTSPAPGDDPLADIALLASQSKSAFDPAAPWVPLRARPPPQLPPSPVSMPDDIDGEIPRKRQRLAGLGTRRDWDAPDHVPSFLPPFPVPAAAKPNPEGPPSQTPARMTTARQSTPAPLPPGSATVPPTTTQAVAIQPSSSDYNTRIPYSQSSLAHVPDWNLPSHPTLPFPPSSTQLPTPQTLPSLLKAYHHILTHRPTFPHPATAPSPLDALTQLSATATPARHRAAMAALMLIQNESRWDPGDLTHASPSPRSAPVGPSFPIPIPSSSQSPSLDSGANKLPQSFARPVTSSPTLPSKQTRIPDLARYILSPAVHARATKLGHPGMLVRGERRLWYGKGVPAPWNSASAGTSSAVASSANIGGGGGKSATAKGKERDTGGGGGQNGAQPNGILTNGNARKEEEGPRPVLPDAIMYATWEYQPKNFAEPLHGGGGGGFGGGTGSGGGGGGRMGRGGTGGNVRKGSGLRADSTSA
ncbi:hypothetical protein BDV98DRAFT_622806 [Pterulicium gracile]|uniref:Bromodomain associated domain-containing protein n=1 Tax=Pterulicium gracile TaxID=1884261 RepID=A0A5C3QN26_9AGAR|nr:hypothetical protein BDV98DRAFT_622806 [Pterula gracilis]